MPQHLTLLQAHSSTSIPTGTFIIATKYYPRYSVRIILSVPSEHQGRFSISIGPDLSGLCNIMPCKQQQSHIASRDIMSILKSSVDCNQSWMGDPVLEKVAVERAEERNRLSYFEAQSPALSALVSKNNPKGSAGIQHSSCSCQSPHKLVGNALSGL